MDFDFDFDDWSEIKTEKPSSSERTNRALQSLNSSSFQKNLSFSEFEDNDELKILDSNSSKLDSSKSIIDESRIQEENEPLDIRKEKSDEFSIGKNQKVSICSTPKKSKSSINSLKERSEQKEHLDQVQEESFEKFVTEREYTSVPETPEKRPYSPDLFALSPQLEGPKVFPNKIRFWPPPSPSNNSPSMVPKTDLKLQTAGDLEDSRMKSGQGIRLESCAVMPSKSCEENQMKDESFGKNFLSCKYRESGGFV